MSAMMSYIYATSTICFLLGYHIFADSTLASYFRHDHDDNPCIFYENVQLSGVQRQPEKSRVQLQLLPAASRAKVACVANWTKLFWPIVAAWTRLSLFRGSGIDISSSSFWILPTFA
jgi:hypothetical protein